MTSDGAFPLGLGSLLYVDFLTNAYALLPAAKAARVPFAFTLYPGGGLALNDPESDSKLRAVFASPWFRKVIVTQDITYNYIVDGGFCSADKVEMIFGVVMPPEAFSLGVPQGKPRWGIDKDRLDVCFMAHRYTERGEDKGFDVFIDAAMRLSRTHGDIHFHAVGPYDSKVVDVSSLGDRITFHGQLDPDEFDEFFLPMDMIVSPNTSGRILPGSFDGFPTASCIEAGLRGVAIFATDEFMSRSGRFTEGQDLVVIDHDAVDVASKIEKYYHSPKALGGIGECGTRRIAELYGSDAQLRPRVELLRGLLAASQMQGRSELPLGEDKVAAGHAALGDQLVADALRSSNASANAATHEVLTLRKELEERTAWALELNQLFEDAHRELDDVHRELASRDASPGMEARGALRHLRASLVTFLRRLG